MAAVKSESANPRDVVRLLLLTACRRDEIVELPWREVDFVNRRLVIPGERMKNGEVHEVPLSPQALAILKARTPGAPNDLVFPSSVGELTGLRIGARSLTRIRKAIGEAALPQGPTLPLSRHSAKFYFASLGRV